LRAQHRAHPLTPVMTLTAADQTELRELLRDLPTLWRHPRVTSEQRKALARTVISTIHVTPGRDAWEIEIDWVGGSRTRSEFLTSSGVHAIVNEAAQQGRTASDIAHFLGERGAIQRSGPNIGQPY